MTGPWAAARKSLLVPLGFCINALQLCDDASSLDARVDFVLARNLISLLLRNLASGKGLLAHRRVSYCVHLCKTFLLKFDID